MEPKERRHVMSLQTIKDRLTGAIPKHIRNLYRYEPIWLGDLDAEIDACYDLSKVGNRVSKRVLTMSNACISQEKLLDTFDRAAGSRHGWIIELYARCGGMDIRKLAFMKLYIFLSDEQRDQLAKIVYLMPKTSFCRFKKLMFKLPNNRAWTFADALARADYWQFDHYIRVLSATELPWKVEKLQDKRPHTVDRPVTTQVAMSPEVEETEDEWHQLQQRIISLPTELQNMIELSLWDIAFRPGRIFPHRTQTYGGTGGQPSNLSVTRLFLAMNTELYQLLRTSFWSDNTWVIGYGDAYSTMDFLNHVPYQTLTATGDERFDTEFPDIYLPQIELHLELRFSSEDMPGAADRCREITSADLVKSSFSREPDILDFIDVYRWNVHCLAHELGDLWREKFDRIFKLRILEELTLDFTEAFAPGDEFIGAKFARLWPAFVYGLPPVFNILAPNEDLRRELYDIFRNNNPE